MNFSSQPWRARFLSADEIAQHSACCRILRNLIMIMSPLGFFFPSSQTWIVCLRIVRWRIQVWRWKAKSSQTSESNYFGELRLSMIERPGTKKGMEDRQLHHDDVISHAKTMEKTFLLVCFRCLMVCANVYIDKRAVRAEKLLMSYQFSLSLGRNDNRNSSKSAHPSNNALTMPISTSTAMWQRRSQLCHPQKVIQLEFFAIIAWKIHEAPRNKDSR